MITSFPLPLRMCYTGSVVLSEFISLLDIARYESLHVKASKVVDQHPLAHTCVYMDIDMDRPCSVVLFFLRCCIFPGWSGRFNILQILRTGHAHGTELAQWKRVPFLGGLYARKHAAIAVDIWFNVLTNATTQSNYYS